jgi:hypothetical protein
MPGLAMGRVKGALHHEFEVGDLADGATLVGSITDVFLRVRHVCEIESDSEMLERKGIRHNQKVEIPNLRK